MHVIVVALYPSTARERHVGPSRTVAGPKTVSCSVPSYVLSTSRRPKPNSHRSQDRVVLCFRLRSENVTSAQAEQSPFPRPCRALFPSTTRGYHVGPTRTVGWSKNGGKMTFSKSWGLTPNLLLAMRNTYCENFIKIRQL